MSYPRISSQQQQPVRAPAPPIQAQYRSPTPHLWRSLAFWEKPPIGPSGAVVRPADPSKGRQDPCSAVAAGARGRWPTVRVVGLCLAIIAMAACAVGLLISGVMPVLLTVAAVCLAVAIPCAIVHVTNEVREARADQGLTR